MHLTMVSSKSFSSATDALLGKMKKAAGFYRNELNDEWGNTETAKPIEYLTAFKYLQR